MKKFLNFCLLAVVLCWVNVSCSGPLTVDNSVSGELDLNRYLGDWYEIARFDHSFERGLSFCKANYSLREDGKVAVLNTGMKSGKPSEANGKAKLTESHTT